MVAEKNFVTTEVEPLFDAADVIRFGKDLFVQHGFTTNLKAIDWLQRHFPDHRVHALNFPGDPYPIHIDATFTPLRPGLILNNPKRLLPKEQRKIFEINDWEIVESAQPAHDTPPPLCYSSVWLSMNVLVLDTNTVCVEASEKNMIKQIEGFGMEIIPVPFRDAYPFGGGLHCSTADVYREGDCEDYFPKQL
jgi:glycine amidinotransferase